MRLGNFRLGYKPAALTARRATTARILIGGVDAATRTAARRVRKAGLTIHDALNDAPNTASLSVQGTAPVDGQDLRISINSDTPRLLFNGTLQTTDLTYQGKPAQTVWPVSAIDDLARLNQKRPFGVWYGTAADAIAGYLIAAFAPGFTATHVQSGLPLIAITFDGTEPFSSCLSRIATLVGGAYYVEDLDLHLFQTETSDAPDAIDSTPGRFLHDPPITVKTDDSQVRTRVYGKGHGEAVPSDVAGGATVIPIADAVMFNPLGGKAIAGTSPDGAQSQLIAYAGIQLGGTGSLVGPGATPSTAPTLTAVAGAGLGNGVYTYAYTDVTAAGESLPSPLRSVTTGAAITNPVGAPVIQNSTNHAYGSSWAIGASLYIVVTYLNAVGETIASAQSNTITAAVSFGSFALDLDVTSLPVSPDPSVVTKKIYLHVNSGWDSYGTLPNASSFQMNLQQNGYIPNVSATGPPGANTTAGNQVSLAGIALGPTGTTQRKVYRTAVGGAQLKLQQTIANNTALVGVQDATADGSLGANAPTSDTSGLTQPAGQVNAGSTTLLTASAGPFNSGGGWLLLPGNQTVRYTGITGNTLTGIPASGAGSILTTVLYGSQVVAAPALIGVTGLSFAMQKGAMVHLWVQRDDLAAQAIRIATDAAQGRVSDGVVEYTVTDERRGEASLSAICDAQLALYSRPIVTVTYATRDVKTKSGKTVHINLTTPPIGPIDLLIQDVTITEIDQAPGVPPRFSVTASTVRFTLDMLLRTLVDSTRGIA
jgi:hypothetical protein